jgi:hypothetical protein
VAIVPDYPAILIIAATAAVQYVDTSLGVGEKAP